MQQSLGPCFESSIKIYAPLRAYGVAFISLRDNLDLSPPSGRLMFQGSNVVGFSGQVIATDGQLLQLMSASRGRRQH